MSEFGSESDDYTYTSPSPETRRNGPFLDVTITLSDEADLERSSDQEDGDLSQSTQSDDPSGEAEPIPTTSTPGLSLAASSSPFLFSTTESPSLHTTSCDRLQCGNVASLSKLSPDNTSFVRRLDYLLQQAADQQCPSITGDNIRIQPYSPEGVSGPESPMVSIAHDEVLESALGHQEYYCRFSPLPSQKSSRSLSLIAGATDNNRVVTVSDDGGIDPRRNKRKAKAAIREDSEAPSTSSLNDGNPSDSYLSASDGTTPAPSRGRHLPSKKRKYLSLDMQPTSGSLCAGSSALSDSNLILSKASPVRMQKDSSNTTYDATEDPAVQCYYY